MGLAISVASQSQMQAQQLSMLFNFTGDVPGRLPVPGTTPCRPLLRVLGYVFPLTHFLPIARGIISKGVGLGALWGEVALLTALLVVILFAGVAPVPREPGLRGALS